MAQMMPSGGPNITASPKAEPDIYWRLAKLSDDFVVIHSLPWLCSAVKTIDPNYAPTGELDFVILHPELGILAIEVKGGKFKYDNNKFVYLRTNKIFDPVGQLRRGAFALREWLKKSGIRTGIGYAWIFPEIDAKKSNVSLAFEDPNHGQHVALYYTDLPDLEKKIVEIMRYWKTTLHSQPLSRDQINEIVDLLCPSEEYGVDWGARIEFDSKTWLILNDQQKRALDRIHGYDRTEVYGGPGTGKTVLAISLARNLAAEGKKVLFLVFNKRLSEKIRSELSDTANVQVMTFHALCHLAGRSIGLNLRSDDGWYGNAISYLHSAVNKKKLTAYDALIIDEGQIFHQDWYLTLKGWIDRLHVFCDETQAFSFEMERLSNREVGELIDREQEFLLTINMRSPKAVFERIEVSIPTSYQQSSPRQFESDTLEEIVSSNPEDELFSLLRNLHDQGISAENIAVITTKREMTLLNKSGASERIRQFADLDVSEKVRGVEFPIVVAYSMDVWDIPLLINAYARATTRVIAIYRLSTFPSRNRGNHPFVVELRKKPAISDVVDSSWDSVFKNLNWSIFHVLNFPEIYWHGNIDAWLLKTNRVLTLQEELWCAHLLTFTKSSVLLARSDIEPLKLFKVSVPDGQFSESVKLETFNFLTSCSNCGKYCFKGENDFIFCCHCGFTSITSAPNSLIDSKEWRVLSLPLLALQKLEGLDSDEYELIYNHANSYLLSNRKLAYQSLLVYTGAEIIDLQYGSKISNVDLINNLVVLLGEDKRSVFSRILPMATNYWFGKGWLEKSEKGVYVRTTDSPARYIAQDQEDRDFS